MHWEGGDENVSANTEMEMDGMDGQKKRGGVEPHMVFNDQYVPSCPTSILGRGLCERFRECREPNVVSTAGQCDLLAHATAWAEIDLSACLGPGGGLGYVGSV